MSASASPVRGVPRNATRGAAMCGPDANACECGALETLCRPRWVAGMVLNEADLNRLDYYIGAKHRLHNRFVHGVGVACGLEVSCHECGAGRVRVSGGYAIGPCGEDIVVDQPDSVDICALIRHCRGLERKDVECRPWGDDSGCRDIRETWVLAIRYDEAPSRNNPMLRAGQRDCGDAGCGGGGTCAGSCGGSCGGTCGGAGKAAARPGRRPAATSCAPTVVCETYRYEVFRAPAQPDCSPRRRPDAQPPGRLVERLRACMADLLTLLQQTPTAPLNAGMTAAARQQWQQFCVRVKSALHAHLSREGATACALVDTLCATACPSPQLEGQSFVDAMKQSLSQVGPILQAAIKDCLCSALLPPCPEPVHDPRLPLALVTVDGGAACRVIEVCNWTPLRRMVGTFPNVAYWLSAFGLVERLRNAIFCLCCGAAPRDVPIPDLHDRAGVASGISASGEVHAPPGSPFGVDFGQFGLFGDWLQDTRPDPIQLLQKLVGANDQGAHTALVQRLDALQAEVDELRRNR